MTPIIFHLHNSEALSIGFALTIHPISECQNRIDDDGDGFIDYPDDSDCTSLEDVEEGKTSNEVPQIVGGGGSSSPPILVTDDIQKPINKSDKLFQISEGSCDGRNDTRCIVHNSEPTIGESQTEIDTVGDVYRGGASSAVSDIPSPNPVKSGSSQRDRYKKDITSTYENSLSLYSAPSDPVEKTFWSSSKKYFSTTIQLIDEYISVLFDLIKNLLIDISHTIKNHVKSFFQ